MDAGWYLHPESGDGRALSRERLPGAGVDYFGDGSDRHLQLVIAGVEVRGDPDTGTWSIVNQNLASEQGLRYLVSVRNVERDRSGAAVGITRSGQTVAALLRQFHQPGRLPDALLAYPGHS